VNGLAKITGLRPSVSDNVGSALGNEWYVCEWLELDGGEYDDDSLGKIHDSRTDSAGVEGKYDVASEDVGLEGRTYGISSFSRMSGESSGVCETERPRDSTRAGVTGEGRVRRGGIGGARSRESGRAISRVGLTLPLISSAASTASMRSVSCRGASSEPSVIDSALARRYGTSSVAG
jgi:hypothetical protein